MKPSVRFKLASIEDIPAITEAGTSLFDYDIKHERAIEFLEDNRHHMILAYDGEQLVGMATGFHYVHPDKDPELFINEVGVLDEYQNQGIGRNLVIQLCAHGKALGCTGAWVGTEKSNKSARKAYIAAGGKEDDEPFILLEFNL